MEQAHSAFNKSLRRVALLPPDSSDLYKETLYKHIDPCLWNLVSPFSIEGSCIMILPDRLKKFRDLSVKIIQKTDPQEINEKKLCEKQKEWIRGNVLKTIDGVFFMLEMKYVQMIDQIGKYRRINDELHKSYSNLHEYYLNGRPHDQEKKGSPSIRQRLKSLNELVTNVDDPVTLEMAFKQLRCLMENDPLFASVFYSYFYEPKKDIPPDLKRKALEKARPYVYFLKFFTKQPINHEGAKIKGIYDLGVLLLNALAGEKIYSDEFVDPVNKKSGPRGKLKGSDILYVELSSQRQFWKSMEI
jgi:hypothetical protein